MSFIYNPFKKFEIVAVEIEGVITGWKWRCHSCSGTGLSETGIILVDKLYNDYKNHLKNVHHVKPKDFEAWE